MISPLCWTMPTPPDESFWKIFPHNSPNSVKPTVNIVNLEKLVSECWSDWTISERLSATKALKRVKGKIPVALKFELLPLNEKNAASAVENGEEMTDTLVD